MNPERWQQIDRLLDAALELPAGEREAFVTGWCGGDEGLRREVLSLLAEQSRVGEGFMEHSAMKVVAESLARHGEAARGDSLAGRHVGTYRIERPLGAGGMGEVYLAHDEKLGRKVALKILPARFVAEVERVRRFEREARAVSALNHPNIVTIYDVGRAGGLHYIATEFVEGRTLREMMGGGLKLKEVLSVAAQTAEALAAAHGAGVVHRDVKPENIMVRADGYVKVLDFGLAKLTEAEGAATDAAGRETRAGVVMGTLAYMSPEQAAGEDADHRTDIWSLGVVLYEMAAGRTPFAGENRQSTLDAILSGDPGAASESDPSLPPEIDHILAKALEKDRELRYQTALDFRADLKRLLREVDTHASWSGSTRSARTVAARRAKPRRWLVPAAASLALLAAAGAGAWLFLRSRAPAPDSAHATHTQLTDQAGTELFPSLAPDGRTFVYVSRPAGNFDLFLQRVGGKNPTNLTKDSPADDTQPAFAPDGEAIAFRSERDGGGVFVMEATGESVRRLTDFGYYPAWSPDGREVAFSTHHIPDPNDRRLDASAIWIVNVSTGERRQLTSEAAGDATHPSWSPTGARIAYWGKHKGGRRDLWTVAAAGGQPVPLTDDAAFDWNPVWSPDGRHVYFSSDRGGSMNLWRVPVDERTGRAVGPPEPVTAPSPYVEYLSFSRDGQRAAYVSRVMSTNIMKVAFDPRKEAVVGPPVAVTRGFRHARSPDPSPDGEWIAYSSQGEKQEDIFVVDKDGAGVPRQLTNDPHKDRDPRWSPDGKSLVFYSDRSGRYEAWAIRSDGSGLRQMTYTEGSSVSFPFWSPDGARLVYNRHSESPTIIEAARPWAEQSPRRIPLISADPLTFFWAMSWSPDGRRLAGTSIRPSPAPGLYTYDLKANAYKHLMDFGWHPLWLSDGRRLLTSTDTRLFIVDSETRRAREILSTVPHRLWNFAITKDDRTIYYDLTVIEADVWLLTLE